MYKFLSLVWICVMRKGINVFIRVWEDLWSELRQGVTPGGMVLPEMEKGFVPTCGWPEFLEKVFLLKHYLDYVHRFCDASTTT